MLLLTIIIHTSRDILLTKVILTVCKLAFKQAAFLLLTISQYLAIRKVRTYRGVIISISFPSIVSSFYF